MLFDIWREFNCGLGLTAVNATKLTLTCALLSLCAIYLKRREFRPPPTYKGWMPFLGCAIEFGKSPLSFIGQKKKELGPLFSLYLAGQTLHFLTDTKQYQQYFLSRNLDFMEAATEAVGRAASISKDSVYKRLWNLHNTVKGKLVPEKVKPLSSSLCGQYDKMFPRFIHAGVEQDLFPAIQRCMYAPIVHVLYRDGGFGFEEDNCYEEFIQQFNRFDGDFEMGVKLPAMLMRKWEKAKKYMLNILRNVCSMEDSQSITLLDELKGAIDNNEAPNYSLMVMFAALANVVPVAFWTLTHVFTKERILKRIRQELDEAMKAKIAEGDYEVTAEDLKKLPYLTCCVQEALRLSSEGVVPRKVVKDFQLMGYDIKKGSMMFLSPYWAHRDPEVYPDPLTFKPERWEGVKIESLSYRQNFLAFGGGKWMCPGRHYGYVVMQTFVASFLMRYNCTVHDPIPQACMQNLVGIQRPAGRFNVTCTPRIP